MWDFITPANLITWQRRARLKQLEQQMSEDQAAGYGVDADAHLDAWMKLQDEMGKGPVS